MAGRFEKFSRSARRALSLALEEAQHSNRPEMGTEHLLLGLARETDGVAARVLGKLGVDLSSIRSAVPDTPVQAQSSAAAGASSDIGLSPGTKKAIELAVAEASRWRHDYIGTEHLLIGILREGETLGATTLAGVGVSLDQVRLETAQILDEPPLTDT